MANIKVYDQKNPNIAGVEWFEDDIKISLETITAKPRKLKMPYVDPYDRSKKVKNDH